MSGSVQPPEIEAIPSPDDAEIVATAANEVLASAVSASEAWVKADLLKAAATLFELQDSIENGE